MYKQNTLNRKIVKALNESMWTDLSAEEVGREKKISSRKSMVIGLTSDVMTNKDLEIESNEKQSTQYSSAEKSLRVEVKKSSSSNSNIPVSFSSLSQ